MIDLAERERAALAGVDLTLVFYAREEGPYLENELGAGARAPTPSSARVDLAVCLEPSDNKLQPRRLGLDPRDGDLRGADGAQRAPVAGRERDPQGGPAPHRARARSRRARSTIDGFALPDGDDARRWRKGGRGRNIVPDAFELNLNHRFSPDTSLEEAQRDDRGARGRPGRDRVARSQPRRRRRTRSHPLVVALREAGVVAVEPKQAWTDVARFAALGVPAVNFGPGENAQAHQRNEWTSIEKLAEGRAILPPLALGARTGLTARAPRSSGARRCAPLPRRTGCPSGRCAHREPDGGDGEEERAALAGRALDPESCRRGPPRCPW